jgi:hypothetical protein
MKKLVLILLLIFGISINSSFHNMLNAQEIKNKTIAIELTNIPKNSFDEESIYLEERDEKENESSIFQVFKALFSIGLVILPLLWKPSRKAVGLLNIILGTIFCFTGIGILIGLPMILFGGIIFFI